MSAQVAQSEHRAGDIILALAALAAGPAAWGLQLLAGFGLSSLACFPHDAPYRQAPPPGWGDEPLILICVNVACLLLACSGLLIAFGQWRRAEAGEPKQGRRRFLAVCGMLACGAFAAAILFDTPAILAVPACWSILA